MNNRSNPSELATFAGGCFWCMVSPFDELPGILKVVSGYTGGHKENPTYEEVCSNTTGHYEAVQITYNPEVFPYQKLLELFWQQIDPTDEGGQFHDRGDSYRTAIFTTQKNSASLLSNRNKKSQQAGGSMVRSSRRLFRPALSIQPKNTIRITIRKIQAITNATGKGRGARISLNGIGQIQWIHANLNSV